MSRKLMSGNEAIAFGALAAGVKIVSGYPGTPSTEVITSLLKMELPGTSVEWSTNEKVAFEIAAGGALMGYRTMCTMKMSGLNVAYDSLIGIAYSGCKGALVIYVADDPGVSAGMCEQDTRGFAMISDMPMLEPSTLQETYDLTKYAFELSEKIQSPVFLRTVTSVCQSHGAVEIEERKQPPEGLPLPEKDIAKYTKAGAAICMKQHRDLIARLAQSNEEIEKAGFNRIRYGEKGGAGIISVGVVNNYVTEAMELLSQNGIDLSGVSWLSLNNTFPYPDNKLKEMLGNCQKLLVAEELEPYLENRLYIEAYKMDAGVEIYGKNDGTYSRIGYYDVSHLIEGICRLLGTGIPDVLKKRDISPEKLCAARPITVCSGCPHRGVYISVNQALKNLKLKKEEVMVTGDIGCTILGISPPFNTLWTEVSMGASIPLAQGFSYGGTKNPVIATIGDSTFFHAGIPGLINAVQHNINMTVVIMDNGWTAMTGMQVNPGTSETSQKTGWRQIDLLEVVKGLGIDSLEVTDPYDIEDTTAKIEKAMNTEGVSVVLARRECAIQAARRKVKNKPVVVRSEKCTLCKQCINITGCPAISLEEGKIVIDASQCNGCGICARICKFNAIEREC